MSPAITTNDMAYSGSRHSVTSRDLSLRGSFRVQSTDLQDHSLGKFRVAMSLSAHNRPGAQVVWMSIPPQEVFRMRVCPVALSLRLPSLCIAVCHVIARGSKNQVRLSRVDRNSDTAHIVAAVQHPKAIRYGANNQFPSESVSTELLRFIGRQPDAEESVSAVKGRSGPLPACSQFRTVCRDRSGFVDATPEALLKRRASGFITGPRCATVRTEGSRLTVAAREVDVAVRTGKLKGHRDLLCRGVTPRAGNDSAGVLLCPDYTTRLSVA
jgi:hypothetical protein